MVPPFLAYYGVMTSNESLVSEAYTQIKLYRNYLRDPSANSRWKHVILGTNTDPGHWSTGEFRSLVTLNTSSCDWLGNGWAAAGILRVLATIQNSEFFSDMSSFGHVGTGQSGTGARHHSNMPSSTPSGMKRLFVFSFFPRPPSEGPTIFVVILCYR